MISFCLRCLIAFYILNVTIPGTAYAQVNDEAVMTHVNHIEEFIERFNFKKGSSFYEYVQKHYGQNDIGRREVLRSLISREDDLQNSTIADLFIDQITHPSGPVYLDFFDYLWYVKVPVSFTALNEEFSADITLELQMNSDYSTEWTIVGIQSKVLEHSEPAGGKFIPSNSHATFFPELKNALASSSNFREVRSDAVEENNLVKFHSFLSENEVSNVRILKGTTYHFLQISGWAMVVSFFEEDPVNGINTGWLISYLEKVNSSRDLRYYTKEELGID